MAEIGVEHRELPIEGEPRDPIELNYDIYKPSVTYSQLCNAIQKDMVLAKLRSQDVERIKLQFSLIEILKTLVRRHPDRYAMLNNTMNDILTDIANAVTLSRGEGGFTATLMRKSIVDQRQTIGYEMAKEKKKSATEHGKRMVGLG